MPHFEIPPVLPATPMVPASDPQNPSPSPSVSSRATAFDVGCLKSLDNDTAFLILEFTVRQRVIPDKVVNAVLHAFPISDPMPPKLKKAILLRSLASHLANGSFSEKTLEIFELIEEIDRESKGLLPSQVMKIAYCSVATWCTASSLCRSMTDFFESFHRIWVLRIYDIEKSAATSLVSEVIREVRNIFWEAVKDPDVRHLVINMDFKETLDLVQDYLDQAWYMEPMPSAVDCDKILKCLVDPLDKLENVEEQSGLINQSFADNSESDLHFQDVGITMEDKSLEPIIVSDIQMDQGKHLATDVDEEQALREYYQRMVQNTLLETANKATESPIKNPDEAFSEESRGIDGQLRRDQLALASEVGAKDTNIEEKETNNMHLELSFLQKMEEKNNAYVAKVLESSPDIEKNTTENNLNSDYLPRTSHVERNSTSHTFKVFQGTDSRCAEGRIQLLSPKRSAVSPLMLIDNKIFAKRRRVKKWTSLEEETLIKSVKELGKGNWKLILSNNPTIFDERTEVDLKDKWRNLSKFPDYFFQGNQQS